MNLFEETPNWKEKLTPLINQYRGKKHPLDYQNPYQLLVMVVLSAQDSDANINKIEPELFKKLSQHGGISRFKCRIVVSVYQ